MMNEETRCKVLDAMNEKNVPQKSADMVLAILDAITGSIDPRVKSASITININSTARRKRKRRVPHTETRISAE